jgi:Protein of unknown function (DUF2489)
MPSNIQTAWPLRDALKTAQAVLDQELGMIEGCIELAAHGHQVVPNWRIDPDFVVFGAISSSTDHLPFGDVRNCWSATALEKADAEIAAINDRHRDSVRKACENVIARFSPASEP